MAEVATITCTPCLEFQRGERVDMVLEGYGGIKVHVCEHPAVTAMEPLFTEAGAGCFCGCERL